MKRKLVAYVSASDVAAKLVGTLSEAIGAEPVGGNREQDV